MQRQVLLLADIDYSFNALHAGCRYSTEKLKFWNIFLKVLAQEPLDQY